MSTHMASVELQSDGRVFLFTYSRTANGFWIMDGLPAVLPAADDTRALGDAVAQVLNASTDALLPERDVRKNPPDAAFLAWFGGSYAKYSRGVKSVQLRATYDDQIEDVIVTPQRNVGGQGGFEGMREHRQTVRVDDNAALGVIVQQALTKAA